MTEDVKKIENPPENQQEPVKVKKKTGGWLGGGRPKGVKNKVNREARNIINSVLPPKERYGLLAELARGVKTQETNEKTGEKKIYACKPDVVALKFLAEQADGKAMQNVDITTKGQAVTVGIVYSKPAEDIGQAADGKETINSPEKVQWSCL